MPSLADVSAAAAAQASADMSRESMDVRSCRSRSTSHAAENLNSADMMRQRAVTMAIHAGRYGFGEANKGFEDSSGYTIVPFSWKEQRFFKHAYVVSKTHMVVTFACM